MVCSDGWRIWVLITLFSNPGTRTLREAITPDDARSANPGPLGWRLFHFFFLDGGFHCSALTRSVKVYATVASNQKRVLNSREI